MIYVTSNLLHCRTFVENKDGGYSLFIGTDSEKDQFRNLPGKRIKAHELKTFLKVKLKYVFII